MFSGRRKWKSRDKSRELEGRAVGRTRTEQGSSPPYWGWVLSKGGKMWMGGSDCSVCWIPASFFKYLWSQKYLLVGVPFFAWCCSPLGHLAVTSGSSSRTVGYRYWSSPGQHLFHRWFSYPLEFLCMCWLALYSESLSSIEFQLRGDCHQSPWC